jgi:high affinity sulfate transporter 1
VARSLHGVTSGLARIAPGLDALRGYRRDWLRSDVPAGLSVAAVAIPTAIAYAQLAGFPAVVGLYASLLPLVVYAVLGSSRQLIVNPDAATCAMVAAIVTPLAAGDPGRYESLAVALAVLTGATGIVAGCLRLGFLADFLGKPVLVGFMNGIAISIVLGQIGKVFGFGIEAGGILPRLFEFVAKLPLTHVPTLVVGIVTLVVMRGVRRFLPRLPAPLVALIVAVALVKGLGLDQAGVAVIGAVPAGLPRISWPPVPADQLGPLVTGAGALALVSLTSGLVTARSFAARNGYEIDVDREVVAIGACNVAAGLCHGFAVTGADSRTAVSDAMGGKTQVTGLVAAAAIALVLLFFTAPLEFLPGSALGAVLISAGLGLFDWRTLVRFARIAEGELLVCVAAMIGVVALGVIQGIGLAVALALLVLLIRSSRPADAMLGRLEGHQGFYDLSTHEGASTVKGALLYRFSASLIFYNAAYFRRRALTAADATPGLSTLIIDAAPMAHLDSTGADAIASLSTVLAARDVRLVIAGALPQVQQMLQRSGTLDHLGPDRTFPTLRAAVADHEALRGVSRVPRA